MADITLKAGIKAGPHGETGQKSVLNKNSMEFKPMTCMKSSSLTKRDEEEYLSTVGSALGELIAQATGKAKYQEMTPTGSVSPSPMPSTAQVTPQMSAVLLPPPPGYDPIVEAEDCCPQVDDNAYYDAASVFSSACYPPPFHLGYKLFVGALPYSVCEGDLFPLFGQFGEILELHIQRDYLGRSKGCAWLRYSTVDECDSAIDALHNNYFLGSMNRPMQLTYASDNSEKRSTRTNSFSMKDDVNSIPGSSGGGTLPGRPRAMTEQNLVPTLSHSSTFSSSSSHSLQSTSSSVIGKLRMLMQPSVVDSAAVDSAVLAASSPTPPPPISSGGRKFRVSGFPSNTFEEEKVFEQLFTQFGPVVSLERVSPSEAVVEFEFPRDAERARSVIDGVTLPHSVSPLTVTIIQTTS